MTQTKLTIAQAGTFKLDGGAMFGVVPKSLWSRKKTSDETNLCTWAMRCLIVERGTSVILIDTGIGKKQDEKFFSHFGPEGPDIIKAVIDAGYQPEEITDVLLTHLHFDHVGGAVTTDKAGRHIPSFPNATYWTNKRHYDWAYQPNPREKASFLKENFVPLMEHGILKFIEEGERVDWIEGIQLQYVYGHTEAQMLPIIPYQGKKLIYCADLIPSADHLGLPYVMAYDVRPLDTMKEKEAMLSEAVKDRHILFFEHDETIAAATIHQNERGKIVIDSTIDI